jgi:hypothetical protein
MRCPKCGKAGKEGEIFCNDDGTKLVVDQLAADHLRQSKKWSRPGNWLVLIGGFCLILAALNYFGMKSPENIMQQIFKQQSFQDLMFALIIIALGFLIITLQKVGEDIVTKLDALLKKNSQLNE